MIYNLLTNIRAYFNGKTSFAYGEKNFTDLVQWMKKNLEHQKYLEKEILEKNGQIHLANNLIADLQNNIILLTSKETEGKLIPDNIFEELLEDCSCDDCPVHKNNKCPNCVVERSWNDEPQDRTKCRDLRRAYLMGIPVKLLKEIS